LRLEVIQLYHNIPIAGYRGKWKMTELVTRNYWCPGVTRNVERYIEGCDLCQRMKNYIESLAEKLIANKVPKKS